MFKDEYHFCISTEMTHYEYNKQHYYSFISNHFHMLSIAEFRCSYHKIPGTDQIYILHNRMPFFVYIHDIHEVYQFAFSYIWLITESYPKALIAKSTDGVTPLDRAIYYRQDKLILSWLEAKTKIQKTIYEINRYNQRLRYEVVKCCELRWLEIGDNDSISSSNIGDFIAQVYGYSKERAMIGLFWDILSYVGIHSVPS